MAVVCNNVCKFELLIPILSMPAQEVFSLFRHHAIRSIVLDVGKMVQFDFIVLLPIECMREMHLLFDLQPKGLGEVGKSNGYDVITESFPGFQLYSKKHLSLKIVCVMCPGFFTDISKRRLPCRISLGFKPPILKISPKT